ncbi:MAG: porin family protein [Verrucomicrobia bacterium]|nr:porin family protein [Verrucomicrobiota bacterium]
MRHLLHSTILASTLGFLLCETAKAESPFYVRTALGPAIAEDITLTKGFEGNKASVDYGASFGLAGGWQVSRWLGLELETGAIYTHLDRLYDEDVVFENYSAHSSLLNVPVTANLVFRYQPKDSRWSGYLKGGLGGTAGRLSMSPSSEGGAYGDGTDWDFVPAYRAGIGVGYRVSKRWTLELGYELFGNGSSEWNIRDDEGDPLRVGFDPIRVHSFQFACKFQF